MCKWSFCRGLPVFSNSNHVILCTGAVTAHDSFWSHAVARKPHASHSVARLEKHILGWMQSSYQGYLLIPWKSPSAFQSRPGENESLAQMFHLRWRQLCAAWRIKLMVILHSWNLVHLYNLFSLAVSLLSPSKIYTVFLEFVSTDSGKGWLGIRAWVYTCAELLAAEGKGSCCANWNLLKTSGIVSQCIGLFGHWSGLAGRWWAQSQVCPDHSPPCWNWSLSENSW